MTPTGIQVETTDLPPCGRCGADPYLQVSVPHVWQRSDGRRTPGRRVVRLCPQCDAHWPSAHGLLAYFALHNGLVVDTAVPELAELLGLWLADLPPTGVAAHIVDAEADAFRAGKDPDT